MMEVGVEIKAEGTITKEDFGIAQEYLMKITQKEIKKKYSKIIGLFPMIVLGSVIGISLSYLERVIEFEFGTILYSIIITLVISFVLFKLFIKLAKRLPSDRGVYLGKHSFLLKEEGMLEESKNQATLLKWSGIFKIEETPNMIYVYADNVAATFIPKHFFLDDNKSDIFIKALYNKCEHLKMAA